MNGEDVPMEIGPHGNRSLFNNPKMSDVRFLVDGQTVYGHKTILVAGSPVFESMFSSELRDQRKMIEIDDLTSAGFKNALRYIYGFEIDCVIAELHESYMAADKYQIDGFSETLFGYIEGRLNVRNSCLIYDQLIKIGQPMHALLARVMTMIIENSKEAFESESFTHIDPETLISLLSLGELSIAEFDLFVAVSKWVDCEVHRQGLQMNCGNRRRVFAPIKGYIVLTALTPEQIANCKRIIELVSEEERGSLLLHRLNRGNRLMIEIETPRKAVASACSVFLSESGFVKYDYSRTMHLSVNRSVFIKSVHTTFPASANLILRILDSKCEDLGLKPEPFLQDDQWSFSFKPPFVVEPNYPYTLQISGDHQVTKLDGLRKGSTEIANGSIVVKIDSNSVHSNFSGRHFVRSLTFKAVPEPVGQ